MTDPDLKKLEGMLGSPELRWLLEGIRSRLERGSSVRGRLRIPPGLSPSQLEALCRLLGRRLPEAPRALALAELDAVLANAVGISLPGAVEALTGPWRNQREDRLRAEEQWKSLFLEARQLAGPAGPAVQAWLDELESGGLLRRRAGGEPGSGRELLLRALPIAMSLPAQGIALSELAASLAGDSHALDLGTPLGALLWRAALQLHALPGEARPRHSGGEPAASDGAGRAEERRAVWESVGVFCDELSASVLVLNLRAEESSLSGRALCAHADAGEPCRLTLRELLLHPPVFGERHRGSFVSICENPTVMAYVADRLGPRALPLICVEGKPRTPVGRVLRPLSASGARLRYHGDFDWEGLRIASFVMTRFGAEPWRMGAGDYEEALASGGPLRGARVSSDWDPSLADAMESAKQAVHEEAVLKSLCLDLTP